MALPHSVFAASMPGSGLPPMACGSARRAGYRRMGKREERRKMMNMGPEDAWGKGDCRYIFARH